MLTFLTFNLSILSDLFIYLLDIWGTQKDPGILPRVLDTTFQHIGNDQYGGMDLKPYLRNDVQCLDPDQVRQERSTKAAIFASVKEVFLCTDVSHDLQSKHNSLLKSYHKTCLSSFLGRWTSEGQ